MDALALRFIRSHASVHCFELRVPVLGVNHRDHFRGVVHTDEF